MIRGTTPTHIFTLPFNVDDVKRLVITYAQQCEPLVEKTLEDCELSENKVKVKLTQEDTLRLNNQLPVEIQIRVLTKDNTALASRVTRRAIGEVLSDEVLT